MFTGIACASSVAFVAAQAQQKAATPAQGQTQAAAPATPSAAAQKPVYNGLGATPTKEDMGNLALASGFKGRDLPQGNGTAKQGAEIYAGRCAMCHGADGEGVHWEPMTFSPIHGPRLAGGNGVPTFVRPPGRIITLAYSAPSPMVIFDTIAVEMPMFRPGTLSPTQVYALTAFILFKNGIIKEDEVMNNETLPKVQMPNGKAFPASDDIYMDMQKRGCYKTNGVCLSD